MPEENADFQKPGVIAQYVKMAYQNGASDLHFIPTSKEVNVFLRESGILKKHTPISKGEYERLLNAFKFSSGLDVASSRVAQDAAFSLQIDSSEKLDMRVCVLPSAHGESLTLRLPTRNVHDSTIELGMNDYQTELLNKIMDSGKGVVLITGLTGSGKTTTFYTLLLSALKNGMKVVTMEDPIERFLDGIVQVQIDDSTGFSYVNAISASLRSDPDIIAIGEIRDAETARAAVNAAFSSRLVVATMHARDLGHAIKRLVHFGIPKSDLETIISCIVHQRLVTLSDSDHIFRTGLFAMTVGLQSSDDETLGVLSNLTYQSLVTQLSNALHNGHRIVRIDGDMRYDEW
ncbi:ATPase, T2SS/T4P/T4SS family [Coprothermobacter platensis]|uniref:ATPase, T2SS/T4P/T4SS family n=1 Tax=Coprothermobacter platensis TaxID=108819 RepID=UPI00039CE3D8|nr:ATPase, T2SS/T4P/T4SS family [Coprothermobacter platensis]